jgi:hypothetical protein
VVDALALPVPRIRSQTPPEPVTSALSFFELQRFDDRLGARRQITQLGGNDRLFGNARFGQAAFVLREFLAAMSPPPDFFLPFATSHTDAVPFAKSIRGDTNKSVLVTRSCLNVNAFTPSGKAGDAGHSSAVRRSFGPWRSDESRNHGHKRRR